MDLLNKKQARENGIVELNEIIEMLKDKRDTEAWGRCVLLASKYIGLKDTRDILSDKKLNTFYLNKIKEIIQLIENKNISEAEKVVQQTYKEITSTQSIHSKITLLICYINEFFKKQEDTTIEDIKKNFIETEESIQN
jgi:hypothetical protein